MKKALNFIAVILIVGYFGLKATAIFNMINGSRNDQISKSGEQKMNISQFTQDQDSAEKEMYAAMVNSERNMLVLAYNDRKYAVTTTKGSRLDAYMSHREKSNKAEKIDTPPELGPNVVAYQFR